MERFGSIVGGAAPPAPPLWVWVWVGGASYLGFAASYLGFAAYSLYTRNNKLGFNGAPHT